MLLQKRERCISVIPMLKRSFFNFRIFTDRIFSYAKKLLLPEEDGYLRINRYVTLAWLAIIGFPLYYWVWTYVFPQPYENLGIRVVGMVLAIPLLFARHLRRKRWFNLYFYLVFTYSFPFFFTFMFFMNQGVLAWSQSLLIATIVLFHLDLKTAAMSSIVGGGAAYAAYVHFSGSYDLSAQAIAINLPVLMFAVLTVSIMRVGRRILADEKLQGMASVLATISHELRTPLRSVDANARGLRRHLPILPTLHERNGVATHPKEESTRRLQVLNAALDRIQSEVQYMNSAIDLLLANAGESQTRAQVNQIFAIDALIADAISRYPFENEHQRALVRMELHGNYQVAGNVDLCIMVLFNLLKNALRAIAKAGKGNITIATSSGSGSHRMVFRDTGCGIPEAALSRVFQRFYAYPRNSSTGIGLAFCRDTLGAWGASITCRSEEGIYTEFIIQFPDAGENVTSR
jgi:two-component system CAI-1 autoinducer sensor kinase/phosphatase CqsS